MNRIILAVLAVLGSGALSPALAAPELPGDFGGILIWIFMAYCSIIVVAQALVALRALKRWFVATLERRLSRRAVREP